MGFGESEVIDLRYHLSMIREAAVKLHRTIPGHVLADAVIMYLDGDRESLTAIADFVGNVDALEMDYDHNVGGNA